MTRSQRQDPIDGWHHVMSRGVNRQPIFYTDEDRLQFGALLAEISNRFGIEIHCYCLMTNHFHLLVRCPMGQLSTAMHLLLSVFARYVNDHVGRVGHLFGDRFCSRLVTEVVYLANTARYIHLNPLDIVGVENAAEYRWSSHRTYVGLRPAPEWLHMDTTLGWFEDVAAFDRFVNARTISSGTDVFDVAPSDVMDAIDLVLTERSDASPRHLPAQRRAVALGLVPDTGSKRHDEFVVALGIPSSGALRTARSRARDLEESDPVIGDVKRRTQRLFGAPTAA